MDYIIRPIREGEERCVFELIQLNDSYHNDNHFLPFQTQTPADWRPYGLVLVCECESKIVGMLEAHTRYVDGLFIENVYVLDEYRGCGIGEALVRRCIEDSAQPTVLLSCITTNHRAKALYEKIGFKPYIERMYIKKGEL